MRVFVKGLNPCVVRKVKIKQYCDFLIANGHTIVNSPIECDVVLIWTCGFRTDVRDNSLFEANRYGKEFGIKVILAGCVPDIDPEYVDSQFDGHIINWRDDMNKMEEFFGSDKKKMSDIKLVLGEARLHENAQEYKRANPNKDAVFFDETIKLFVSEGCRFQCSFCAERLTFPPYRSFPEDDIVEKCRELVKQTRYLEVTLQADSIGDYGCDINSSLPNLIRKLKTVHVDLKVGMQGFNPAHFIKYYDEMKGFILNGDIGHIRLSIQSASEKILSRMERPYTLDDINRIFFLLKEIGFDDFSTDVIVGFPGETDDDFGKTIEFVLENRPRYVLLSSFMDSLLLPASHLSDKVDEGIKMRRLAYADKRFSGIGIYCSADRGSKSLDRLRRINLEGVQ